MPKDGGENRESFGFLKAQFKIENTQIDQFCLLYFAHNSPHQKTPSVIEIITGKIENLEALKRNNCSIILEQKHIEITIVTVGEAQRLSHPQH